MRDLPRVFYKLLFMKYLRNIIAFFDQGLTETGQLYLMGDQSPEKWGYIKNDLQFSVNKGQ